MIAFSDSPGVWQHVALVRSGNLFTMYRNGQRLGAFSVSATDPALPSAESTLRLGRCTDGRRVDPEDQASGGRESQYYGFIDDVAVFTTALTEEQITAIARPKSKRIAGTEAGLLAGWVFENSKAGPGGSGRAPLPARLKRPLVFQSLAGAGGRAAERVALSSGRDNSYDSALLPRAQARFKVPPPFASGEVWRVVSGWGSGASHSGGAVFSLDLHSVEFKGTAGEPVRAVARGIVREVVDNDAGAGNRIVIEHHPVVLGAYLHNAKGSSRVRVGDEVTAGQHIADIGPAATHLHFGIRSQLTMPDRQPVTIPYAFQSFDACTLNPDGTCPGWVHVKHGVPLNNQWIRWT